MDMSNINWLAVIVCVIVAMVSGFIWYHPSVFFKPWWRGIGKEGTEMGDSNPMIYVFTIIAAFVEAVSVFFYAQCNGQQYAQHGLRSGLHDLAGFRSSHEPG